MRCAGAVTGRHVAAPHRDPRPARYARLVLSTGGTSAAVENSRRRPGHARYRPVEPRTSFEKAKARRCPAWAPNGAKGARYGRAGNALCVSSSTNAVRGPATYTVSSTGSDSRPFQSLTTTVGFVVPSGAVYGPLAETMSSPAMPSTALLMASGVPFTMTAA